MSPTATATLPTSVDSPSIADGPQWDHGPEPLPQILAALNSHGIINLSAPIREALRDLDVERYAPDMILCANGNYVLVVRRALPTE